MCSFCHCSVTSCTPSTHYFAVLTVCFLSTGMNLCDMHTCVQCMSSSAHRKGSAAPPTTYRRLKVDEQGQFAYKKVGRAKGVWYHSGMKFIHHGWNTMQDYKRHRRCGFHPPPFSSMLPSSSVQYPPRQRSHGRQWLWKPL